MANHFHNWVTITGPENTLAEFKAAYFRDTGDADEPIHLDFNTVIPMPEIIRGTEKSTVVDHGLVVLGRDDLLRHTCGPFWSYVRAEAMLKYEWIAERGIKTVEQLKAYLLERDPDCVEKAQRCIKAYEETGYIDWYTWRWTKWGTKSNAYHFYLEADDTNRLEFGFDTAWSPPIPVLEKLRELWPALTFEYDGRDEFDYDDAA
jgi:hypothetical protein